MNKEIIKAMNKKETKIEKIRKWWNKNDYKVMRVILFPIWIATIIRDKVENKLNARQVWNEEKANEILNYYIPRKSEWNEENKTFWFFDNGYGWDWYLAKRNIKLKDKRFWNCNKYNIRKYLTESFELEGFTKIVLETRQWTELQFVKK